MRASSEVCMIAFVLFAAVVLVRGQGKRVPFTYNLCITTLQ